jgi:hypothetical protein
VCQADRACAEGGAPALQAGFLGALPSRSTERSIAVELHRDAFAHAARWPCTSLVSRRIRFDSERGLSFNCVARAARRSCTSLVTRWLRFDSERGLRLSFHCPRSTMVVHLTRNEVDSVRFRTWAPVVPKAPSSMPVRVGTANCGHFSRREAGLPSRASRVRISVSAPLYANEADW